LNFALDIAGPIDDMDAATVAMFKRFQAALLTMAREWRDPDTPHAGNGCVAPIPESPDTLDGPPADGPDDGNVPPPAADFERPSADEQADGRRPAPTMT
jgi:hypothetical protein